MGYRLLAGLLTLALLCAGCGQNKNAPEPELPASSEDPAESPPDLVEEILPEEPPEPEPEPLDVIELTVDEAAALLVADDQGSVPIATPKALTALSVLTSSPGADGRSAVFGMKFRLTEDINMSGFDFTPVGGFSADGGFAFDAEFDGQDHVIRNLTVRDKYHEQGTGLFGAIGNGAIIRSVHLTGANIFGAEATGGIVGLLSGGTVTGCSVRGDIRGKSGVGGFAGVIQAGLVSQCAANAQTRGADSVGGFCGAMEAESATVSDCYGLGTVVLDPWPDSNGVTGDCLGGFIGDHDGGELLRCLSVMEVYTNFPANTIGAFAGYSGGVITSSYYGIESTSNWKDIGALKIEEPGLTGCTVEEITEQDTFAGWDFNTVWGISGEKNRGLPYLRAISE